MLKFLWRKFLTPISKERDLARREFILNILLFALILLSLVAFLVNLYQTFFLHRIIGENPFTTGFVFLIFSFALFLSKTGKSFTSALILITSLTLVALYNCYSYGADLPVNLLLIAFIIVMTGILLGTIPAFIATLIGTTSIILFSYLEIWGIIHPNKIRLTEQIHISDSVVHVIILVIIAIVSWMFNRESEKALKRARASERELKRERDLLEIKVEERTSELKRIQLEKITQLYRFAEVGKLTSGFMHDLVTPISLISLNLDQLNKENRQKNLDQINILLKRAINGTKYLENFVISARKQLQNQDIQKTFSLSNEIKHVIQILGYKIKESKIKIVFDQKENIRIFGNPIKFNQIAMNLISNAIDAYHTSQQKNKTVKISIETVGENIEFNVQDFGSGIAKENLKKVFDPFFTTKTPTLGTGIGLSITQDIIKKHFKGKIQVKSNEKNGTIFSVLFPKKQVNEHI